MYNDHNNNLSLRLYYKSQNYYIFVFDYSTLKEEENMPRDIQVFFRIKNEELYSKRDALINEKTQMFILKDQNEVEVKSYEEISSQVRSVSLRNFKRIETIFENVFDFSQQIDFLPILYQEKVD